MGPSRFTRSERKASYESMTTSVRRAPITGDMSSRAFAVTPDVDDVDGAVSLRDLFAYTWTLRRASDAGPNLKQSHPRH